MKRVLKDSALIVEEFYTILSQIEATLNFPPLVSISADPNDHILNGCVLIGLTDPNVMDVLDQCFSRYRCLQKIKRKFRVRCLKEQSKEASEKNLFRTLRLDHQV